MIKNWLLFAMMLFVVVNYYAQDSLQKKKIGMIVKADVLGPLNPPTYIILDIPFIMRKHFSLSLEKPFKKRNSFQLTGTYSWNTDIDYDEYYNITNRTDSKIF